MIQRHHTINDRSIGTFNKEYWKLDAWYKVNYLMGIVRLNWEQESDTRKNMLTESKYEKKEVGTKFKNVLCKTDWYYKVQTQQLFDKDEHLST